MTLSTPAAAPVMGLDLARLPSNARRSEPAYFGLALLLLAAMPPTLFAGFLDGRTFLGVDVWDKPFKFEAALVVYLGTLAVFAQWARPGSVESRWYRMYRTAVVAAIVMEMVWIGGAAMLGTASHFNKSPTGMAIYGVMGIGAVLLTTASTVLAWQIARNPATGLPPALNEAIVLGLALVLPLTLVTAGTMASMDGHLVGGSGSDAGGAMLMGWARDAGDLRVAHFFATHAMHAVPLFGLVAILFSGAAARISVWLFALAYVGFVMALFAQALSGQPFLAGMI